jgi:hypothetical protein
VAGPFEVSMTVQGRGDFVATGQFTDSEHAMLELYLDQYELLSRSEALRSGVKCSWSLSWNRDSGSRIETDLPDDDTLGVFLHRLRPFILQEEPASYLKVRAAVCRRVDHPEVRDLLKKDLMRYDGRVRQTSVVHKAGDRVMNSESFLFDWLNSHEYHRDPDKRAAIDTLVASAPPGYTRAILTSMLIDKANSIINLAHVVGILVGRSPELREEAGGSPT